MIFQAMRELPDSKIETFETARLIAEKLQGHHFADLVALHLDPVVSRYLGGVRSAGETKAYLEANLAHWDRYGFGLWALKAGDGSFVGRAGIRHISLDGKLETEVAFTLRSAFWGVGLATEITAVLVDVGLNQLRLPSLIGFASVQNQASRRVLEKSDFVLEKTLPYKGEDVVVYRRSLS